MIDKNILLKNLGVYNADIRQVSLYNGFLYISEDANVHIYDISDPSNPIEVSNITEYSPNTINGMVVNENLLGFGTYGAENIVIYDISDPSNPVKLSEVFPGRLGSIDIKGNLLVSDIVNSNMIIYDISDPSNPVQLSSFANNSGYTVRICMIDDILSTPTGNGFSLYDISDPSNPIKLSEIQDCLENVNTTFIDKNILVISSRDQTLKLYDISKPEDPILLTSIDDFTDGTISTMIKDNILISGTRGNGIFKMFDISDPSNPILISIFSDNSQSVYTTFLEDNILITGSTDDTVNLYDISGYQNDFVDIPFAKLPSFTFQGNEFKTDVALSEISVYLNDTHLQSYTTDLFQRKEITIDPATLNDGDNFFLVIAENVNGKQSRATAVIGKEYFSNTTLEHDTEEYKLIMPQGCMHAEATWGQHAVGYVTDSVRFLFDRKPNNMLPVSEASTATDNTVTVKRVQNVETEVIG
jgi:hypothetical protein